MNSFVSETFKDGEWLSTFRHSESIKDIVADLSNDNFLVLIRLASSALKHLHTSTKTIQYKEALEKEITLHTQRLQQTAKETYDSLAFEKESAENKHSLEIVRLRATIEELQIQNKSIKEQFADIQIASEKTFRSSLDTLKAEKDEQYSKEIARLREDTKERISELQKIYNEIDLRIKKESAVSSEIGKKGERDFETLAGEYTEWGTLINTSKIPHNADWACIIRNCNTLFEIKNYTSDIPLREITKFEDDIKLHGDVHFGAFISMNTPLQGKRFDKMITIDWTTTSQMLVYISCFHKQDMPAMFMFLDMCADIAYKCYRIVNDRPDDSESCLRLQGKIKQIQCLVEKEILNMTTWIRDLKGDHQLAIDLLTKQHTMNLSKISHMKTSLIDMIEILGSDTSESGINGSVSNELVPEVIIEAKPEPKKKRNTKAPNS
jgi:hypothetical protein